MHEDEGQEHAFNEGDDGPEDGGSEHDSIRVNFSRPIPVFPIHGITMLPQQVLPLHIFEPRYRQLVDEALDGPGQIALASFEGDAWQQDYEGTPPLRAFVCVGQIVNHEKLADGRYNILLQGVCRARLADEPSPPEGQLYRSAMLEPVGIDPGTAPTDQASLDPVRGWVEDALAEGGLSQLAVADRVLEFVRNEDVPTGALLELLAFTLLEDGEIRYRLLAEPDVTRRARIIHEELARLERLLTAAEKQVGDDLPKGCNWN